MNAIRAFALTVTLAAAPFVVVPAATIFTAQGTGAVQPAAEAPCRALTPNDVAMAKASAAIRRHKGLPVLAGNVCDRTTG